MVANRSNRLSKRSIILIVVVVIVAIVGLSYAFHIGPFKKTATVAPTASQYTKGQPVSNSSSSGPKTSSSSSSTNASGTSSGSQKSNTSGNSTSSGSTAAPIAPSGQFVSDHHPNLGGSPAPNSMTSVCNTSPGATCEITFTMGSTVKSLPAQTVDAGGATYWNWTLQQYGLSGGTWQIEAIAKLNGQTATSTDPTSLVVSP